MKVCSLNVQNHHRGQNTPHNETNVYKQSKYDQNCNKTSWIVQSRAWDGAVDHHDPLQLYVHESVKRLERSTAAGSTAEPEQVLSDLTKPREIKKGLLHHQNTVQTEIAIRIWLQICHSLWEHHMCVKSWILCWSDPQAEFSSEELDQAKYWIILRNEQNNLWKPLNMSDLVI